MPSAGPAVLTPHTHEKNRRDRLRGRAQTQPDGALGFEDETWGSRWQCPAGSAWSERGHPLRLVEQTVNKKDKDPKAVACYGRLVRCPASPAPLPEQVWLRFVQGRCVSGITTQFLNFCSEKLAAWGKRVWGLIWDNASWHVSQAVRKWIKAPNRPVKQTGQGVRILVCPLPTKSPWLNPMEPRWGHGQRCVMEADRLLTAQELEERICAHFRCSQESHLTIPKDVV